ncbi:hypothetical protein TNIN_140901 [Trichonephila inaurata madagascariensis]|uniref:Secreted protein n=1 Tax=Trichonephila inaurata madagascariensis TaxID=2747483 RepID=A0A8X7CCM0_9ARAC|nr:hypothetical protein TNIN_140901 [Trichonephila inaurata madagascariensis]
MMYISFLQRPGLAAAAVGTAASCQSCWNRWTAPGWVTDCFQSLLLTMCHTKPSICWMRMERSSLLNPFPLVGHLIV